MVKVKPRHFKTTLVFLFSLFLAIAMAIFTAHSINTETDRIATSLESQALALTSNLAATGADHVLARDFTSIELMLLRSAQFEGVRLITVADAEGKILSTIKTEPGKGSLPLYGQEPITVPAGKKPIVLREESKITIWHPMLLGKVVGWVRVEFGLEVITRVTNKYLIENFIYGMAILSIVSFILVYFLRKPAVAIEKYTEFADGLEMNLGRNIDVD
ncbi:MAG: hypothetical protein OEX00_07570, partial [Gammaproteobacteria bacterium]|nr:hypothetical protein [Gammaproteobacteria bacterium]